VILVEVWNWFDDVGGSIRSLDGKKAALRGRLKARAEDGEGTWTIRCLFVVRRTRRNERLVREVRAVFAARFPASSGAWLGALTDPARLVPSEDGFVWSTANAVLQASRLG
jgi:hypothetical protein